MKLPGTLNITILFLFFMEVVAGIGCGLSNSQVCQAEINDSSPEFVDNPSLETSNPDSPTRPVNWEPANWGNNTAVFEYDDTDAYTGMRSVKIELSNWSSGDAKWIFSPVQAEAGTTFVYRDHYKSTVATKLVATYHMADGNIKYQTLIENVPAADTWSIVASSLSLPLDVKKVTVYHLIAAVGSLQLDDVSLTLTQEPDSSSGVPNGSFEQALGFDLGLPLAWQHGAWGNNLAEFDYALGGRTGCRCVAVTLSNHLDGDAKWYFDPLPVSAGAHYRYSDYYLATTDHFLVVRLTMSDGAFKYVERRQYPPKEAFTLAETVFAVPPGAVAATVFHGLSHNGMLRIDDTALTELPAVEPFHHGIISLTFDDGWLTDYTNALPIMAKHEVVATHYVITNSIDRPNYMSLDMLKALLERGDEIASHTVHHADLTTLSPADVEMELVSSKQFLEANGFGPVLNLASPYGAYSEEILAVIKLHYKSHRTIDDGFNSSNIFDPYRLKIKHIFSNTTASEVDDWAAQAARDHSWLILVYHRVEDLSKEGDSPDEYNGNTTLAVFDAQLAALKNHGLPILTVRQALDELFPGINTP